MQGTRVPLLVREDPTCCEAATPVCCNYWVHEPELLSPSAREPVLCNKGGHCSDKPSHLLSASRGSLYAARETQHSQKAIELKKKKRKENHSVFCVSSFDQLSIYLIILGRSRVILFKNKEPENWLDHICYHMGHLLDFEFQSDLMGCLWRTPNASYSHESLQRRTFQSLIWKVRILLPMLWGRTGKKGWMSLDSRVSVLVVTPHSSLGEVVLPSMGPVSPSLGTMLFSLDCKPLDFC